MAETYPIVGLEESGIQSRLELRDLEQKPIQFSLFIRALNKLLDKRNTADPQSPDYINSPTSWWQIGSIHGLPYIPWSGDPEGPQNPDPEAKWQGYCYHSSALFPTWHRISIMLVEQAVVREAIAISTELEQNDPAARNEHWVAEAKTLRFPFWDWTRPETAEEGIPKLCQDPQVSIVNPGGSETEVSNPLNHYRFTLKPGDAEGVEYMGQWDRTFRWVNRRVDPTKEMYDQAQQAFSVGTTMYLGDQQIEVKPVSWLRGKVSGLFTYDLTLKDPEYGPNMWGYFSNTGASSVYPPMPVMPPSLEESHNMVHLDTGGDGSMSVNEYASFDPIFFLHHCNVDRLYAFWEYLYPNYWTENGWKNESGEVIPFLIPGGTWWQNSDAPVNHATPLVPFRSESLDYWSSDETRSLLHDFRVQKYYTYPPIRDPVTGTEVRVDVPYDVDNLALRMQYQRILYTEWGQDLRTILEAHQKFATNLPQHANLLLKVENEISHLRQFIITGEMPEFSFPGSYRLELYLLPEDRQQSSTQVVNSISVLGRANPDKCDACKDRRSAGNTIRGYMHLDSRIILYLISRLEPTQLPEITDLDKLNILIQESFGLRLVKPDGTRLAAADPHVPAHHAPLEESKVPRLTLHSYYIGLSKDDAEPIQFQPAVTHGRFKEGTTWKTL